MGAFSESANRTTALRAKYIRSVLKKPASRTVKTRRDELRQASWQTPRRRGRARCAFKPPIAPIEEGPPCANLRIARLDSLSPPSLCPEGYWRNRASSRRRKNGPAGVRVYSAYHRRTHRYLRLCKFYRKRKKLSVFGCNGTLGLSQWVGGHAQGPMSPGPRWLCDFREYGCGS